MRIAVVGAGVSGCLTARLLASQHEVTLFEADGRPGGHAQTVDVDHHDGRSAVDTAFMVFNRRTYPNFCRMLDMLGVESQPSDMSFSVRCDRTGLEYQGGTLTGLFAQWRNAIDPRFLRMLWDIVRFNNTALTAAEEPQSLAGLSVGEFLRECGVGRQFVSHYLAPMAAAIWSSNPRQILSFPASFLVGFFANHGLLQLRDRPQWRTIREGSRSYVASLLGPLLGSGRVRLNTPVKFVRRTADGVTLELQSGESKSYDQVVLATHADKTLRFLQGGRPLERKILQTFPYQKNIALLHTDTSALPQRPKAWASWNYRLVGEEQAPATVTYDLTRLQRLGMSRPLLLTLNPNMSIDGQTVIREFVYRHPAFSTDAIAAQQRWAEISGRGGVHFCGAYWGFGFHEDGVNSALAVTRQFGIGLEACTAACTRAPSPTTADSR